MIIDTADTQTLNDVIFRAIVIDDEDARGPEAPGWTVKVELEHIDAWRHSTTRDVVSGQLLGADYETLTLGSCDLPVDSPLWEIWDTDGSLTIDLFDIAKVSF